MLLNCGVGEYSWESLDCKEIQPAHSKGNQSWIFIHWKDWCWNWNFLVTWCKILWSPDAKNWLIGKDPWWWERLKTGGEGDDRGWDGWMASLTRWTWVWASSGSLWWTEKARMLQSMGLQRVRHDWATELTWTEVMFSISNFCLIYEQPLHERPWCDTGVMMQREEAGEVL